VATKPYVLDAFIERLRKESIGDPSWITAKKVYEYQPQTIEVAAVLKLVRAAQGIHAMQLLCNAGLFVDFGAITRCVLDCLDDVRFLLERYPHRSDMVDKFLKEFYSKDIDNYASTNEVPVLTKKIRAGAIRAITGRSSDSVVQAKKEAIYNTFCGYVHAGYCHIMQMFGGPAGQLEFKLSGITFAEEIKSHQRVLDAITDSTMYCVAYTCEMLELRELEGEVLNAME